MNIAIFVLMVASVACSVEDRKAVSWSQKTKNLETKFKHLVMRKLHQVISGIRNAEYSVNKDAEKLIQSMEREINSSAATALEDISTMRSEAPIACYLNAAEELYDAQEAALCNLLTCVKSSRALQDIAQIGKKAEPLIKDAIADAEDILNGVHECTALSLPEQWACVLKYVSIEMKNFGDQWPEAKAFLVTVENLVGDLEDQIKGCLNDPTQMDYYQRIIKALNAFYDCFYELST